ncbi:MAG: class I SAM-dependent methyltransferase, partial [Ginsengibacter sp.]
MITYSHCPVCNSEQIYKQLSAKDHTVSGEEFEIWECSNCSLRFTQNVPAKEDIGKYYQSENYVSHSESKRGVINRLYHLVRKRTLKSKQRLLEKYTELKTGKLLDIGAGTGAFLNTMQTAGWQIRGLEPDETARANALELYNIELLPSEELFAQVPVYYDAITMWHVLEHVHDLHDYITQIHKLLKPGGMAFIAVPNYTSSDAAHYQAEWAAYDVP